jgi:transcriptional regulator with XRE-family HTH domain
MNRGPPALDLEATREGIVTKLRQVRQDRGWTQAELAQKLGMSQARLSVVERGGGSISAEQFLAFLALANLSIQDFLPHQDKQDEIQNALARLGALHLREVDDIVATERFQRVEDALAETLAAPRSARLLLALGPVLVWNIEHVNLDHLNERLSRIGLSHRLGWLVQSVAAAIARVGPGSVAPWGQRQHKADFLLADFLARLERAHPSPREDELPPTDHLDPGIRSMKSLAIAWQYSDSVARRWRIATELTADDFAAALRVAGVDG